MEWNGYGLCTESRYIHGRGAVWIKFVKCGVMRLKYHTYNRVSRWLASSSSHILLDCVSAAAIELEVYFLGEGGGISAGFLCEISEVV